MSKYIIGVDEAGRGPLAGPVAVGVVCIPSEFLWESIPGVDDSKKLTALKREAIFAQSKILQKEGKLFYAVCMIRAEEIDRIGIVSSVKKAMGKALQKVAASVQFDPSECAVKLDGLLTAPLQFTQQETIIGGDGKEKVIGLASILAKVTRDRHMVRASSLSQYSRYGFAEHKGYGTKIHRERIKTVGLSKMHRKSYCMKLLSS